MMNLTGIYNPEVHKQGDTHSTVLKTAVKKGFCTTHNDIRIDFFGFNKPCYRCEEEHKLELNIKKAHNELFIKEIEIKKNNLDTNLISYIDSDLDEIKIDTSELTNNERIEKDICIIKKSNAEILEQIYKFSNKLKELENIQNLSESTNLSNYKIISETNLELKSIKQNIIKQNEEFSSIFGILVEKIEKLEQENIKNTLTNPEINKNVKQIRIGYCYEGSFEFPENVRIIDDIYFPEDIEIMDLVSEYTDIGLKIMLDKKDFLSKFNKLKVLKISSISVLLYDKLTLPSHYKDYKKNTRLPTNLHCIFDKYFTNQEYIIENILNKHDDKIDLFKRDPLFELIDGCRLIPTNILLKEIVINENFNHFKSSLLTQRQKFELKKISLSTKGFCNPGIDLEFLLKNLKELPNIEQININLPGCNFSYKKMYTLNIKKIINMKTKQPTYNFEIDRPDDHYKVMIEALNTMCIDLQSRGIELNINFDL